MADDSGSVKLDRESLQELADIMSEREENRSDERFQRERHRQMAGGDDSSTMGNATAMAGLSGEGMEQSVRNTAELVNQTMGTINNIPNAVRASIDAQGEHIAAINALGDAWGDYGGRLDETLRSTDPLAREFNVLSPLLLRMRQEFDTTTMGGRSFAEMGHSASETWGNFNAIFNDTTMLQGLYATNAEFIAASEDPTHAANEAVFQMASRMPVFQEALGLSNEQLQTFYDIQLTMGGQTTDSFLASMSNITLSLRTASFNTENLADHIANLTENFETFGHLGPEAVAEFAALSQTLGLDDPSRLAGLVPSLDSFDELTEFQQQISDITKTTVQLDVPEIMTAMIQDPARGMEMLVSSLQGQGVFEGLDTPEGIMRRNMIAETFNMSPDELMRIAENASTMEAEMSGARAAIADGKARLEADAAALMAADSTMSQEEAMRQAAADEAAEESQRGIRTEQLNIDADDVVQEGIAAETAVSGITAAQDAVEIVMEGLEATSVQSHALGATIEEDLQPAVQELAEGFRGQSMALRMMTRATQAREAKDATGARAFTDQQVLEQVLTSVQDHELSRVTPDGETQYDPALAASLTATAAGLQAGMAGMSAGPEYDEQQRLFSIAMDQARAAGATGLTAENLADISKDNREEIFGELADEINELSRDTQTTGLSATTTGLLDDLGDDEQRQRQQAAMVDYWNAVLETQSPTPPDAAIMEPWNHFFDGIENLSQERLSSIFVDAEVPEQEIPLPALEDEAIANNKQNTLDAQMEASRRYLEDIAARGYQIPASELPAPVREPQELEDLLAAAMDNIAQTPTPVDPRDVARPIFPEEADRTHWQSPAEFQEMMDSFVPVEQLGESISALEEVSRLKNAAIEDSATTSLASMPEPIVTRAPGTSSAQPVVKIYLDGALFFQAVAGASGVPGIMVEKIEEYLGDKIASVGEVSAATGMRSR